MRKVIRNISLDLEIDNRLRQERAKGVNASELINSLLIEYFKKNDLKRLGVEKIDKLIELTKQKEALEAQMKDISR